MITVSIEKIKNPVQRRLVIPLLCVLLLLVGGFSAALLILQQKNDKEFSDFFVADIEHSRKMIEQRQTKMLMSLQNVLLQNNKLHRALAVGDREQLLADFSPIFQNLRENYSITHLYFHNSSRVNLLRLHAPEKHGDTINRFTMFEAERTGKTSSGIELGPLGTFTLRVVQPVYDGDTLLGYLELGQEVESLLLNLQKRLGVELLITVHKDFLQKELWEVGRRMLGKNSDWEHYKVEVVTCTTFSQVPADFLPYLHGANAHRTGTLLGEFREDKQLWRLFAFPLHDVTGVELGDLFIFQDITASKAAFFRLFLLTAAAAFFLICIVLFFYRELLKKTDRFIWQQQDDLRRSEGRLNEAQQQAKIGNWELDIVCNHLYWSDEVYKLFGLQPQQFIATFEGFLSNVHPDDRETVKNSYQRSLKDKEAYKITYRLLLKDRTEKVVQECCQTFYNQAGDAIRSVGTVQDITAVKEVERKQRESEDRLTAILNASPDVAFLCDVNGIFLQVNAAFSRRHGLTAEEVLGRPMYDFFPKDVGADRKIALQEVVESKTVVHVKDSFGGKCFSNIGYPIIEGGKVTEIVVFSKNITAEVKLEEQYRQAQKMESIGLLAGGVAHDFNNMLGVILGHTELALEELDASDPLCEDLRGIESAARRSADLTRQLLAFARKQTVSPRILNLNETVSAMLKMVHRLIGENIDLAWKPGLNLWNVKVDPGQVDQILVNLCVNGRDAIEGEGQMAIETENVVLDQSYCDNKMEATPGSYVMIAVSDSGSGMEPEVVGKIFDPFFTTKEIGQGTGLGLATVYGIVKQNEGFIYVYSEPETGTTFKIYLPRYFGDSEKEEIDLTDSVSGGKETILLVEDELLLMNMVVKMLEFMGYNVLMASTPDEAMGVVRSYKGSIDLLLTDIVMPGMNGLELSNQLSPQFPQMKQLFMSGYTSHVIQQRNVLDEERHFIQKPFSMQEIGKAIRKVLAAEDPVLH